MKKRKLRKPYSIEYFKATSDNPKIKTISFSTREAAEKKAKKLDRQPKTIGIVRKKKAKNRWTIIGSFR